MTQKIEVPGLEPIDIIGLGQFEAGGKVYFLEPQISIERFKKMNEYEIELTFSTSFKKHYAGLTELRQILNEARFVDAAVKLRDLMEGMHRISDSRNHHSVMKYCALILNTKDEDRRAFDEKLMDDKIKDWEEAGIPISSFFSVVLHTVSGLTNVLKEISRGISEATIVKS